MRLVIVESPAKANKIAGFLGTGWRVEASGGHVRDLPEKTLGVDVANGFRVDYEMLPGKARTVKRIREAAQTAEAVYVATDPDREGEAIAWHVLKLAHVPEATPVFRVAFHSITRDAVRAAMAHPRALDVHLIDAQHTRRIVDRLVGYLASPLASAALKGKYSAGRVQSAGLCLIVEREREIAAFTPQTHYGLTLLLEVEGITFSAKLARMKGAELPFATRDFPEKLLALLNEAQVWVRQVNPRTVTRSPHPPFTTATLQQAAAATLGFAPERTMQLAQGLYEQGQITYPRTDGVSVAPEAQTAARGWIDSAYGADYLPPQAPTYAAKALHAQEAHEAIRPTDVHRLPADHDGDAAKLYALIWRRFVASQMSPARFAVTTAQIAAGRSRDTPFPLEFHAHGRTLLFDGYKRVDDEAAEPLDRLPTLTHGQSLTAGGAQIDTITTRPPARYSEAALIQALEQRGIGRPSTYASTLKTLKARGYVRVQGQQITPTGSGQRLCDYLTAQFGDLFASDYTARLETQLDRIAVGEISRDRVLHAFWEQFLPALNADASPRPIPLHPLRD